MIDGLVVIDKPAGMTSHDVVGRCRRAFGQRRVGHGGTLDPDATGVLLVGLGRATRLLQWITGLSKSYAGEIVLGVATSTLDESGEVTGRSDLAAVGIEQARAAAAGLTGAIEQVPPMVSAVKVGGRRLHELAREGVEVERKARPVTVSRFDLEPVADPAPLPHGGGPVLSCAVDCSSGTYVRVLAADLGARLGGSAYLRHLRRTAVGPFSLADAVPLEGVGESDVLPPAVAVGHLDPVRVGADVAAAVRYGKVLETDALGVAGAGPWAVLDPGGDLLAVYQAHGAGRAKPAVVLAEAGTPPADR